MNKFLLSFFAFFLAITFVNAQKIDSYSFEVNGNDYVCIENSNQLTQAFQEVQLGFNFSFNSHKYDYIYVSDEGWLSFNKNTSITGLTDNSGINSFISPILFFDKNGNQERYKTSFILKNIDNKNCLITQWENKNVKFQAFLFESGEIEFKYDFDILLIKSQIENDQRSILYGIINKDYAIGGGFPVNLHKKYLNTSYDFFSKKSSIKFTQNDKDVISTFKNKKDTQESFTEQNKNLPKTTDNFTTPGADTWICPAGVTSVTVHCIGGGGGGGGSRSNYIYGGGGGAGGSYATNVMTVTPGNTYNLYVGNGGAGGTNGNGVDGEDSWFNNSSTVNAVGGAGGAQPNGGIANGGSGTTSGCVGTTVYAGGNGADGTGSGGISGGGGGGAGSTGAGGNASGRTGGTGTANGGGDGGDGRNNNEGNGRDGLNYGGGGSGAFVKDNTNHAGGSGAGGAVQIVYSGGAVTYCDPSYNPTSTSHYIDDFSTTGGTANITNNNTGAETDGYGDYTALHVDQLLSNSINFSIAGDGTGTYGFAIWVDWNQDGDFADTGEDVYVSSSYASSATGSFIVPAGATVGATTMRVVADYYTGSPSDPCTGDADTEFEDYTFNVVAPVACTTPTDQPTSLNLTPVGSNQIDGSFTAASSSPDGYLIVYSTNSSLSGDPVDGTTYSAGNNLGGGTVLQVSNATTFSHTCIAANTTFYYFIFSVNSACGGGPLYLCSSSTPSAAPLSGNATTGVASADETLPYSQNFDTNDGWTYGAGGTWARGNQTDDAYGPPSGHSGNTVAGTNLNANYASSIDDYLVTPSFNLSGTNGPIIDFWMDMESESSYDGGTVQIQVNGCSWLTVDMNDPGYSGLTPNDTDVDGLQDEEDGWSGDQPAQTEGEWDQVKIDLFALTTSGLNNISSNDIIQVRFWFGTDGTKSKSVDPGWYIDDYNIYDPAPCTEPTAQPTNLSLTPGYSTIDGTFDAASPAADEYLVIVSTDPTLSAGDLPVDGTNYGVGDALGDGTVVLSSNSTSFTATGLSMGTTYYFFVFSYNTTACAGRNYLTTNPLTGNETTYDCSTGTVPYKENFDGISTPSLPSCWAIEDNDAPDDDWVSYSSGSYSSPNDMHISYDFSNPLDDWAFSPGLILTGGTTYTIEFQYKAAGSSYTEKLEVYYGTGGQTSGDMSTQLFRDNGFSHTDYQLVSVNFTPGSNGTYYFGWHAYSITNQLGIYVDDIFIYEPGPPAITSLSSDYLYKDRGKQITITGTNLGSPTSVDIGGVAGTVVSASYDETVITFPSGTYPNGTLTYTTALGSTTTTIEVRTRNLIPVDASASADADEHQTITSAVDGIYAWYGNTAFNAGDLPGAKTILVSSGTYAEMVVPNSNLNPVAGNGLSIETKAGQQAVVNASGLNYGFNVNLDYTTIKGFKVQNAINDNIQSQGNNCIISYNECLKGQIAGIRAYNNVLLEHNLVHENTSYGIYLENAASASVSQNTIYKNGGLPGAAGYTRTVDLGSGSIYSWEYNSSWTQIPSVDDDTYVVDFGGGNNFPFDFAFWGTQFVQSDILGISSNGILNLGSSYDISFFNYPFSEIHTNHNTLSCNWDDMDDDSHSLDGKLQYVVRGTAPYRRLIVVWYDRTHYRHRGDVGASNTDYVSVEAKIFETTNVIEYHYNDIVYDTDGDITEDYDWFSSSTIGIKKDETLYDEYHYSSDDDLPQVDADHGLQGGAIRYTPNPATGTELYIASGSNISVENNIISSLEDGGTSPYFAIEAPSGVLTTYNYNDTYKGTNTNLVKIGGTNHTDLASWGIGGSGNIETDPKFVDVANADFHIKSSAAGASFHNGEWPPLTASAGTWTADNDLSPDVDTGDPAADYSMEQPDNGSRLNIGVYGNTLQATKTTVLVGIWTGAVDTVWNVPNNWSDAVVPTGSCVTGPGSDATIPDVSAESGNFPYISNIAEVEDLTIDANAYLTILPDAGLTVCGTLTNNGGNAGLVLKSDNSGTGSLIHSTANVPGTVELFLSGTQYHYIGSPVIGATDASIGIQGGVNGIQFYDWDASMHWNGMGASPPTTIDYAPWGTTYSGVLSAATGYAYYYAQSTLNYTGNLNQGTYNLTLSDESGNSDDDDQGWNFIANPYASSIDWDIVTGTGWDNDVESAIYLFDDDGTGVQANYRYYVPTVPGTGGTYGVGTGNATKNIPVGQGFFIKSDRDNQPLVLLNTDRIHSSQNFYKNTPNNPVDLIRLTVEGNNASDEAVIRFIPEANSGFDVFFDARKLIPANQNIPQLFSILNNQTWTAINSLPKLTASQTIDLGFICSPGSYTIKFQNTDFIIPDVKIYIEDLYNDSYKRLQNNIEFNFNHEGGISINRFKLHFVINTEPYVNKFIPDQEIYTSNSYQYQIDENVFADNDFGDILSYTATLSDEMSLPAWLIFDAENKTFFATDPVAGEYIIKVTVTDLCGLQTSDEFILSVKSVSSDFSILGNEGIFIYPNPSNGIFTLNSKNDIKEILISDIAGRKVYENAACKAKIIKIKLSDIPNGVYTIKVKTSNNIFIKKLMIN